MALEDDEQTLGRLSTCSNGNYEVLPTVSELPNHVTFVNTLLHSERPTLGSVTSDDGGDC